MSPMEVLSDLSENPNVNLVAWGKIMKRQGLGFRVYVLGFRVSGLRGSSVKDPTPKHEKRTTSPMPKILTPTTFFNFPVNAPEGSRATHTFCP